MLSRTTFFQQATYSLSANVVNVVGMKRPLLLPLSAKSDGALRRLAQAYADLLSPTTKGPCGYDRAMQLCLDAGTRRVHQSGHRLAAVGRSAAELRQSIETQLLQPTLEPVGPVPQVAFLFTGQGAGYMGMGRALYERNAVFSAHVQECDALMAPLLDGLSILEVQTRPFFRIRILNRHRAHTNTRIQDIVHKGILYTDDAKPVYL